MTTLTLCRYKLQLVAATRFVALCFCVDILSKVVSLWMMMFFLLLFWIIRDELPALRFDSLNSSLLLGTMATLTQSHSLHTSKTMGTTSVSCLFCFKECLYVCLLGGGSLGGNSYN